MPLAFAVVCEAKADFRTATTLAERVIRDRVDWIDEDSFVHCPLWHGRDQGTPYILWTEINKLADAAGLPRIHGHFDGAPGEHDAKTARRALQLFKKWKLEGRSLEGVILLRDDDNKDRLIGLERACNAKHSFGDCIVTGLARCMRESWVLAGFDPADSEEVSLLTEARAELGFDPRLGSHQLTATHKTDKLSAKRVLGDLTRDDPDREARCWEQAPLDRLRERGRESGLADFLEQVLTRMAPLFLRARPPA